MRRAGAGGGGADECAGAGKGEGLGAEGAGFGGRGREEGEGFGEVGFEGLVGNVKGGDAGGRGRVGVGFLLLVRWVRLGLRVESDPDAVAQAVAAFVLEVLVDPARPDAPDVFGVEGDAERPALEAAGAEEEVEVGEAVGEAEAWTGRAFARAAGLGRDARFACLFGAGDACCGGDVACDVGVLPCPSGKARQMEKICGFPTVYDALRTK